MAVPIYGANGEDQRLTMTIRLWLQNKMEDHFLGHNPLWRKLKSLNQVVKGGFGTQIQVPIKYPAPGGPQPEGVTDAYTAMSHSRMTGIGHTLWDMAQYRMPISAPERELVLQGNLTRKLSYLDSVMEIAADRFMDLLRQHSMAAEGNAYSAGSEWQIASLRTLFNGGGVSTTGPYEPLPLAEQLVAAVGVAPITNVGSIERNAAGMAYFCTPLENPGVAEAIGKAPINHLITLGTRGSDRPDLVIVTADHYDVLMGLLQNQRVIAESKLSDFGFDAFTWRGCDVIYDDDVPLTSPGINAFAINTKALKLCVRDVEPEVVPIEGRDDSIKAWKSNWYGALVMTKMGRGAGARHCNLV